MAALPHKNGGYRANKKISGKEYQIYCRTLVEAERKQSELDALSSLKPKRLFRKDGRIIGICLRQDMRPNRNMAISVRLQMNGHRKEISYSGCFEEFWLKVKRYWKEYRELNTADIVSYRSEIQIAKRFYMKAICELESRIN